jgi:hypothetical protein
MTVLHKKVDEPYVNWNLTEGKPMSSYHAHLSDKDTPLWEYPIKNKKKSSRSIKKEKLDVNNLKLAIYSTYCGAKQHATFCNRGQSAYPSYFISNNREVLDAAGQKGWNPLFLENAEVTPDPIISAAQSKISKVLPHLIPQLSEYDFLFYVDDKYTINEELIIPLVQTLYDNNSPIAMKKHPFLNSNILSEYTESLKQPRYFAQRQLMMSYIAAQVKNGLVLDSETHFATGCILRDMRHPDIKKLNETWHQHIRQCGIECQVSFFFITQLFPNIMILPTNVFS